MTVKEFLKKGRGLGEEIEALEIAKERALCKACKTTTGLSDKKVQTSMNNNSENNFSTYSQYSSDLDKRLNELKQYRSRMLEVINKIDNSTYRTILISYYINCMTWGEVAKQIGYEVRYTQKLHGLALEACEKVFDSKKLEIFKKKT